MHLVTSVSAVIDAGLGYVFTDGHAIMRLSRFFDDPAQLAKLDWQIIHARQWAETEEDDDRQRRKQAEFLVRDHLPWDLVSEIGVMTPIAARRVEEILDSSGTTHGPAVRLRSGWYYQRL